MPTRPLPSAPPGRAKRPGGGRVRSPDSPEAAIAHVARRWHKIHRVAAEIEALAGLQDTMASEADDFVEELGRLPAWRCDLAATAIADIEAMIEPGLCALRTIAERGRDTAVPARALLGDFERARENVQRLAGRRTGTARATGATPA